MSTSAPLRVPGTDNDPAARDYGTGQSLEPTGAQQPPDDDPPDPHADVEALLRDIGDPLTLRVAQIHGEIQQILRMHRDVHDGIDLAADQVQDKRIDFLEAGPQVEVADYFIEFVLVFFLESPLLGKLLRRAFRFAGSAATSALATNRALRLRRIRDAAQSVRRQNAENARAGAAISKALRENQDAQRATRDAGTLHGLSQKVTELRRQQDALDAESRRLRKISDRSDPRSEAPEPTPERLKEFFAENENVVTDTGVAAAKAAVSAGKIAPHAEPTSGAANSVGVQIKNLAQNHLRDIEFRMVEAGADADMLLGIAQRDPFLGPACYALLSDIYSAIRRSDDRAPVTDLKQVFAREVEKLIWALMVADQFTYEKPLAAEPARVDEPRGSGAGAAAGGQVLAADLRARMTRAPVQMEAYLRERFFPGEQIDGRAIFSSLREHKRKFLEANPDEDPFAMIMPVVPIEVVEREEDQATDGQ